MRKISLVLSILFFFALALIEVNVLAQIQPIQFKNLDAPITKIPPPRTIKHPPIVTQLNPATIKINKLQPIPFRPFTIQELRHPKTHPTKAEQPIALDEVITLKSGRKITGRQLLEEINKLEQQYNALGYSLRRPVKTPIVINETIIKRDLFERQNQESLLKYRPPVMVKAPKFASMQTKFTRDLNQMPSIIQNLNRIQPSLPDAIPQPITKAEYYDGYWGDRDYFAAGLHGKVQLDANKDEIKASAEGWAKAIVFNHEWKIVEIKGNVVAPTANPQGQMQASLRVTALGEDLFTPVNLTKTGSLAIEGDQHIGVDESIKIPVVELGPFSINVTLGFAGSAGIRYGIYLTPASAQARFVPYLETKAYGQAGLNVWVLVDIEAGVGCSLTLVNDYLTLSAIAGIGFDQPQPYFYYELYGQNTIDALSGEIYAYVTVDYYFDSDTWKWNIFSWKGFHHDGYVFGPVSYNVPIRPKDEPDAWAVTIYEHSNYGGKSRTYTIFPGKCQAMQISLKEVNMNDVISSVKVGKNVAVYLFEHHRYSGRYLRLNESVPDLKSYHFNDIASSLIVFPKSMGYPAGVWLIGNKTAFSYIHDSDSYDSCSCKPGVTHHPNVPYNDDITKIIIPKIEPQSPPWGFIEVELFEHENYKGRSIKFRAGPSGGEFNLPPELSRKVSSLRIYFNVNDQKLLQRQSW